MQAGDVVELKSGGPKMTISSITSDVAECTWFATEMSELSIARLPLVTLQKTAAGEEVDVGVAD